MELKQFKTDILPLRGKLLNYARKMVSETSDAEDVVQEVMLKLWNIRIKLNEYQCIESFAMRMTHNLCIDLWRKSKPDTLNIEEASKVGNYNSPDRLLEQKDQIRIIGEIIDSLPGLQQAIIRMKDVEGYEMEEIVEITGCNPESIRSNLSRARKKVRDTWLKMKKEKLIC